jgi:hypothetical protein
MNFGLALGFLTNSSRTHVCYLPPIFSPFGKKPAGGSSSAMPYGGGLAGATAAPAAAAPAPVAAAPAAPAPVAAAPAAPAAPAQRAKSYRYVDS